MIRAVIFDVDGVLIESEALWVEAYRQFAKRRSIEVDEKLFKSFFGAELTWIIGQLRERHDFPGETEQLVQEIVDTALMVMERKVELVHGVRETLDHLRYNSRLPLRLAVASQSPHRIIEFIMEKFDLWDLFELLESGEDVGHAKPAPDIYLDTAKKLHVPAEHCVVVEDSVRGIASGNAAHMPSIALAKEYVSVDDSSKARLVVKRIADITPQLIASL